MSALSENDYRLIEKFIDDKISLEEHALFEARMEDTLFSEELKLHQEVSRAIHSIHNNELKDEFMQILASREEHPHIQSRFKRQLVYWAAASVVFCVIVGFWLLSRQDDSNKQYFVTYYKPFPATLVTRGGAEAPATIATSEYINSNYRIAAGAFQKAIVGERDLYAKEKMTLLLGNCYLEIGENTLAQKCFQELVTTDHEDIRQHALWYLALTVLKKNEPLAALQWLKKIQQTNSIYKSQAIELSNKLLSKN
jgi:tetratricopeptide (TPR) repeat protein